MEANIIDIKIFPMLLCYFFSGLLVTLYYLLKLEILYDFLVSLSRMTIQLVIAGFLLRYIFEINNITLVVLIFLIMSFFASYIILNKSTVKNREFIIYIIISLSFVGLTINYFFLTFIVGIKPWYDAVYFIPVAGMILGNTMSSSALLLERFFNDFNDNKKQIETYLTFGATPLEALRPSFNKSMRVAVLPTLTSMSGMGLVFLPGMMTGQILSGIDPLISIKYQIAIMLAIISSITFTSILLLTFAYRLKVGKGHRIIID